jgi:hypothetical protein
MRLFEVAMHHARAALAEHRRLRFRRRRCLETRKRLRHFLDDALVIDGARRRHHHVGAAIMLRQIAAQHVAIEFLQRLGGAEQRAPIGWSG